MPYLDMSQDDHRTIVSDGPGPQLARRYGPVEVRGQIEDLVFFTHHELLIAEHLDRVSPSYLEFHQYLVLRSLRRGLTTRFLLSMGSLEDALTLAFLRRIRAQGAQIRLVPELDRTLLICDGRAALTATDPRDPDSGAILTEEPGLVSGMSALFRLAWERAAEFDAVIERRDALPPEDLDLLALLLRPGKDASRARQAGVSLRTFHRRVADLYQRLGAGNRTEAALIARDHGLS
ncbi:hypothetical protein [Kitasatospora sp. GAS204B]|uniref:hypothetical protein n=1 Tax=unclassified Kitasatospora TaxID=2633591 RepID=UPI002472FBE5|nr:hypothetical protein [Kitasatospora sp. GAS204B]MDH6121975.1 hypothetical protein [Kitasatospora sp. GAS204B]